MTRGQSQADFSLFIYGYYYMKYHWSEMRTADILVLRAD